LRSLCRAARVHEELRLAALGPSLGNALAALGGRPVVLRGVALGHTVYDHPALRHCHDIDLLVPRDAVTAIGDGGFPVSGHRRLLAVAPVQVGWAEVLGQTIEIHVEGVTAHALSPSIELIGVCVHAATSGRPHSLLWTIDAALLIRAGNVAWEGVVNQAREWRVDSHAAKTLAWLRAHLDVPVPPEVVAALRTRRRRPGPVRRWWPSRAPELSR
jgi:hypothetical protein